MTRLAIFLFLSVVAPSANSAEFLLSKSVKVCNSISKRVEDPKFEFTKYQPNMTPQMKIFIGDNPLKYNKDDFYLDAYSYDINNNKTNDLIAIDWHGRGGNKFYLAFYVYEGKGSLLDSGDNDSLAKRKAVANFLKTKQFLYRKNKSAVSKSEPPSFAEDFTYLNVGGETIREAFVGYYEIEPMVLESRTYIVAKKVFRKKNNWNVYDFTKNPAAPELICRFQT